MGDNRNMILAILLSLIVLMGWQYFVAGPQIEATRRAQQAQMEQVTPGAADGPVATGQAGSPAAGVGGSAPAPVAATRDEAAAASPRVPIDTPEILGSISLRGARIDDIRLKGYRETVDPDSPLVRLLNPAGGPDAYYAEFGFAAPAGDTMPVPNGDTLWSAPEGARLTPDSPLVLTWDNGAGLAFTRTITVDDHAMFEVEDTIANAGGTAATLYPYGFVIRYGTPQVGGNYILHEGLLGVFGDAGIDEVNYGDIAEEGVRKPEAPVASGWLGITDKYWATAVIPQGGGSFMPRFLHASVNNVSTYQADYLRDAMVVPAGASASTEVNLFAGAKVVDRIDTYAETYGIQKFDLLIDWGWFYFLTKPMFWLIDFFYRLLGNFGLAILAVTVVVKAVFFPLANKSYASMSMMKKIQPELMDLRDRYKDDKVKQQQAMMELYKREKINPLAGCLPILVQIPVFFSLYKVLFVTIEMRHAPFFGWIQDLSAPDPTSIFTLFGLFPWDVPQMLMIGIWPIIMGITMWVQMKLNPAPTDPTQAAIFNWMPLIFTFMLGTFPAGLVIYWAWNNTLSVTQQAVIMKRHGVKIELFDNIKSTFAKKSAAG